MLKGHFPFRGETQKLDAEVRSSASGEFIELPDGFVHYEVAGPTKAQPVILVHGFSIPYYTWDPTFGPLAESGFQVLRYDLYGRGLSDRPKTTYNQDLFDQQLADLLTALEINPPVDLVGLSIGAAISVIFADRHPTLVRKLCLLGPSGFPQKRPLVAKLMQAPLMGEILINLFGDPGRFPEKAQPQMKYLGYKRALLSTLRHGPLGDLTEVYHRVGQQKLPTLLIWGREDRSVPFDISEKVRAAIPHAEFRPIDETTYPLHFAKGHVPHYEQPEVVNPILIEFLNRA